MARTGSASAPSLLWRRGAPRRVLDFGAPDPASDQADTVHSLWRGTVIAALVVGAVVWGLIGWSLVRYRRRSDDVPDQRAHNIPLEVVYTAIPVADRGRPVLLHDAHPAARSPTSTDDPDVTVEVVGFQWQWQFRYEADGGDGPVDHRRAWASRPSWCCRSAGRPGCELVTEDVNHSFWVPRFLSSAT